MSREPVAPAPGPEVAQGSAVVLCPVCNAPNTAGRKFCTQCGKNLWDTCYQCGALVAVKDRYCGACGADLVEGLARQADEMRQSIARAEDFRREKDYHSAIQHLLPLTEIRHTALRPLVEQARQFLQEIQKESESQAAQLQALENEVEALFARRQYRQVVRTVEAVPPAIRTSKLAKDLADALARLEEIDALARQLRECAGAPFSIELVRLVGRLLDLDPGHVHGRQVMQRIHRRLVRSAAELLAERRYDEARRLLEHVPRTVRSEEMERLRVRATDLAEMVRVLQTAPGATPALAALAERFGQLAPQDPRAATWRAEIAARLQNPSGPVLRGTGAAASSNARNRGGPTVVWLAGLPGVALDPDADHSVLNSHPCRFAVACGLALQGLELGAFSLNLQPESPPLLQKVWRVLHNRPPRSAWGLDLGTAALKAVKLVYTDRHKPPRLAATDLLEHRKPLSQTGHWEETATIVEDTLGQFATRHDLRADRCCLGLPRAMLWVRRLEMPMLDPPRMARAVGYEAKSRFPVPLAKLVWDYTLAANSNTPSSTGSARLGSKHSGRGSSTTAGMMAEVVVAGAKRLAVKDILLRAQSAGLHVDAVQGAPLALANFLHWAAFGQKQDHQPLPAEALAALDLGCEGMTFTAVAPGLLWIQQSGLGASRVVHFLARQRQIPLSRAEPLARNPAEADSPASVLTDMDTVFDDYCEELRATLEGFRVGQPQRPLRQIMLVGGGMLFLGLPARLENR